MNKLKSGVNYIAALLVLSIILFSGCSNNNATVSTDRVAGITERVSFQETTELADQKTTGNNKHLKKSNPGIPKYSGEPYVAVNNNVPEFKINEITDKSFENYSTLDSLGRCQVATASVGKDIMPKEKRESISSVKPTGWHFVKYDNVEGKILYNRCHLIGYQLTGENVNEKNLITGTRYMNVDGMLPFENMVTDYVKETGNHVMYRVTPVFEGNDLVARGVKMEGYSVEDKGKSISFNVFCYNVQPGITIDYSTGDSRLSDEKSTTTNTGNSKTEYILNLNSHKFHLPECSGVKRMSESNKGKYTGNRQDLIDQGYEPCGMCNP